MRRSRGAPKHARATAAAETPLRLLIRLLTQNSTCNFTVMTTTVEPIYEGGKLHLPKPLSLPEKSRVRVTIESDSERETWLKLSEESLLKTWGSDADDVFNELLKK